MSILAKFAAQIAEHKEIAADMTQVQKGGGGSKLWPEGYVLARLTEYVELGSHAEEFQGEMKPSAPKFKLGFRMFGEGYMYDGQDGAEAEPGNISTFELTISRNEKAKAFKLFAKMNYDKDCTNFAEMLGNAYMIKIVHKKGSGPDAKVTARLDLESILPPLDPLTKQPYPVPDAAEKHYRLFLFDNPSQEQWDSLFLPNSTEESFLHARIREADNFAGSAVEALVGGAIVPEGNDDDMAQEAPQTAVEAPKAAQAVVTPKATVTAPKPAVAPPKGLVMPKIPTAK